jgi:hypothetical protein
MAEDERESENMGCGAAPPQKWDGYGEPSLPWFF